MKMMTNEMEAEADKWRQDDNNDIVKRARNMSSMAFSMYQFTKGEGTLKTTQDLFTQAEYFAEEANRLYKVARQFSYQVISSVFFYVSIKLFVLIIEFKILRFPLDLIKWNFWKVYLGFQHTFNNYNLRLKIQQ